jgi:hypothetical protein
VIGDFCKHIIRKDRELQHVAKQANHAINDTPSSERCASPEVKLGTRRVKRRIDDTADRACPMYGVQLRVSTSGLVEEIISIASENIER